MDWWMRSAVGGVERVGGGKKRGLGFLLLSLSLCDDELSPRASLSMLSFLSSFLLFPQIDGKNKKQEGNRKADSTLEI